MTQVITPGVDPYLVSRLGEPVYSTGLEVKFHCPCEECVRARHDRKHDPKLFVNFAKGVFYCVRSSWGGPIALLYSSVGLDAPKTGPQLTPDLRAAIGIGDEADDIAAGVVDVNTGVALPDTTDDWAFSDAAEWLMQRLVWQGVPIDEVSDLVERRIIRRGAGRYWNRVFFVDMYGGKVRYWTGRTYVEDLNPKYLNPYNVPRRAVMGNLEEVEKEYHSEVIVCEGAISAIVAGRNAVWTYGRVVTKEQIELLDSLSCARFVLVSEPDHNAKQNTLELARALFKVGRECVIVDMPVEMIDGKRKEHDPASLGRPRFRQLVDDCAVRYSWSTEVYRRISACR